MQNSLLIILLIGVAVARGYKKAIEVTDPITSEQAGCLKSEKIDGVFIRAWTLEAEGAYDVNACGNYKVCDAAALDPMLYLQASSTGMMKGAEVFSDFYKRLTGKSCRLQDVKFVWLWVTQPTQWNMRSPGENTDFIKSFITEATKCHFKVGILTNPDDWALIAEGKDYNGTVSNNDQEIPLWLHSSKMFNPSFDDFKPFGGWVADDIDAIRSSTQEYICRITTHRTEYLKEYELAENKHV